MKFSVIAVVLIACVVGARTIAAESEASEPSGSSAVVGETDRERIERLSAENEALRRENQMLRRELVSKRKAFPGALLPEKITAPRAEIDDGGKDTGYWISQKSKIRHNNKCRNYKKVKGRSCGPKDGKPCKICGG